MSGPPANDAAFDSRQVSWADMTPLNTLAQPTLRISAVRDGSDPARVRVVLQPDVADRLLPARRTACAVDGEEILPIEYDDNYVTVFGGETAEIGVGRPPVVQPPTGCG